MADALLVFSPLQEDYFFVLRSPCFDQTGVTPLLRRRLFGLQILRFSLAGHCALSAGFSKHTPSPRLLPLRPVSLTLRLTLPFVDRPSCLRLAALALPSVSAAYAASLRAYHSSIWPHTLFTSSENLRKTCSAVAYFCFASFLQRTRRFLSKIATPLEVSCSFLGFFQNQPRSPNPPCLTRPT